jgi:hypothetical protein
VRYDELSGLKIKNFSLQRDFTRESNAHNGDNKNDNDCSGEGNNSFSSSGTSFETRTEND